MGPIASRGGSVLGVQLLLEGGLYKGSNCFSRGICIRGRITSRGGPV